MPLNLPHHLILELTRHCNYHCPYCYCVWHEFPELAPRNLSTAQWTKIIDKLLEHSVSDILFSGGEVLTRPDITDIVAYTRKKAPGISLGLFTNGSRMTDDLLRFFKRKKVQLSTSLQGIHTYGEMTGTRRTCFPVLSMLEKAKRMHWPFGVSITVTKKNASELKDIFSAAVVAGASVIQMGVLMMEGRARMHEDLALTRSEWQDCKMAIRALPNFGTPYTFCDEMICECRKDQPQNLIEKFGDPNFKPCPAGRDFGVIGPDGRFRSCLHMTDVTDLQSFF